MHSKGIQRLDDLWPDREPGVAKKRGIYMSDMLQLLNNDAIGCQLANALL